MKARGELLAKLQCEIRAGRRASALALWRSLDALQQQQPEFQIEEGFLALLDFQTANRVEDKLLPHLSAELEPEVLCRRDTLFAILANRAKDPLTALARIEAAIHTARQHHLHNAEIDALIEASRIHGWMGRAERSGELLTEALAISLEQDESSMHEFVILARFADLYSELQRWQLALRYIQKAKRLSDKLGASVFVWQLRDCEARVMLALERMDALDAVLVQFKAEDHELPAYLRFRWRVTAFGGLVERRDSTGATRLLAEFADLGLGFGEGSYESAVIRGLEGRLALLQGDFTTAQTCFNVATSWSLDQGLAVPYVAYSMLAAEAHLGLGQIAACAERLNAARGYCVRRGLDLQREQLDAFMARHAVPVMADTEVNRSLRASDWKDRTSYTLIKALGNGGQASVYLAYDGLRERHVAIKVLRAKRKSDSTEVFASLRHEVRALSAVRVPGLAKLIACGSQEQGDPYIVQEYIAGQTLRSLTEQSFDPVLLLGGLVQVAETLAELHRNNLAHRDVKPENIILSDTGRAVLVDLGIASLKANQVSKDWSGTLRYMAPPGLRLLRKGSWQDCYAFGVTLLDCFGGGGPVLDSEPSWLDNFFLRKCDARRLTTLQVSAKDIDAAKLRALVTALLSPWSRRYLDGASPLAEDLRQLCGRS